MLRVICALSLLALSSCGPTIWDKEGATQMDFNKDDYACRKDAIAYGGAAYVGYGVVRRAPDRGMYQRCMVASGYTARQ